MTREQMIFAVATHEVIDAIGEEDARAIFDSLMNKKRPEANLLFTVAYLGHFIGREEAKAIFEELLSY